MDAAASYINSPQDSSCVCDIFTGYLHEKYISKLVADKKSHNRFHSKILGKAFLLHSDHIINKVIKYSIKKASKYSF